VLLRDTYGSQNVESGTPLADNALFRVYSMTKPLTCIAGMICYERGFFAMDDPVGLHLPEFASMSVIVGGAPRQLPDNCPLTIGNLFTHTNGLSREPGPTPATLAESVLQ
jgi:CubicO group peptidase (beta-lactamase class C family)